MNWKAGFLLLAVAPLLIVAMPGSAGPQRRAPKAGYLDWKAYGGSPENIRHPPDFATHGQTSRTVLFSSAVQLSITRI